jgi:ketosteroid isomerase-like protein
VTDLANSLATARAIYAAFERGDLPGFFALMAHDMSWNEALGHPYGGTYIGAEAIVQNVMMPLGTQWDGFSATTDRFLADGEIVVVLGTYRGTFKATGRSVTAPFAHVWTIRNGKVQSLQQHTDTAFQNAVR